MSYNKLSRRRYNVIQNFGSWDLGDKECLVWSCTLNFLIPDSDMIRFVFLLVVLPIGMCCGDRIDLILRGLV